MRSHTTARFWKHFRARPLPIRRQAVKNYRLWKENPRHPGLHFKRVGPNTWSARVGDHYRALAAPVADGLVRFWIGPHDEYERMIAA